MSNHVPNTLRNKELANLRIKIQELAVRKDNWQCCTNCDNFNDHENADICRLFEARPPAYIIVNGCEDHTMKIPF
ncbi:MAG: hypothetical protein JWR85_4164 [Marmoricola sp.]|nr:hypothetical protein [Marmoricola sp.]